VQGVSGPTEARVPATRLPAPDPADLLRRLTRGADCLTHVEHVAARAGSGVDWPEWAPPQLRAALARRGVARPWSHQAAAASLAHAGRHVVVSTGTASGKSLAYHLPVLSTLADDPRATAIYVAPTKALAADQYRVVSELADPDVRPSIYDGDTPMEEREWVRAYSRFVLTNPDMLHRGVMPRHAQWSTFLRRLRYVVIDECHAYRGVFGSHVAHTIRRLRRVCARYGTAPVFILASATVSDPATTASRLIGLDVAAVTEDGSPRGGVTFALWEPPLLPGLPPDTDPSLPAQRAADLTDNDPVAGLTRAGWPAGADAGAGAGSTRVSEPREMPAAGGGAGLTRAEAGAQVRVSALGQTADLLADGVAQGSRTLAFVRSRRGAEVVASMARRTLRQVAPDLVERVAAYRAGYLREECRSIE
jgi:DEAD/DEAH box helicase domain-containing protein